MQTTISNLKWNSSAKQTQSKFIALKFTLSRRKEISPYRNPHTPFQHVFNQWLAFNKIQRSVSANNEVQFLFLKWLKLINRPSTSLNKFSSFSNMETLSNSSFVAEALVFFYNGRLLNIRSIFRNSGWFHVLTSPHFLPRINSKWRVPRHTRACVNTSHGLWKLLR